MTAETKVCKGCGVEKPLAAFDAKGTGSGGRRAVCKACMRARRVAKDGEDVERRSRPFSIERIEVKRGTIVRFGDEARMQPKGEHRTSPVTRSGASSIKDFERF